MKRFTEEVEKVKEVYNKAWAKNWGAVPMTDEEFDALAADLKHDYRSGTCYFCRKGRQDNRICTLVAGYQCSAEA